MEGSVRFGRQGSDAARPPRRRPIAHLTCRCPVFASLGARLVPPSTRFRCGAENEEIFTVLITDNNNIQVVSVVQFTRGKVR
ncbi:hypothetical protein E2C01_044063 [Portunus trituberculatus]|uniref:Uncharacterized protein n=1 Tax=Portunus trituberculatus TaxID=210409 RepID=A0A5B7FYD8_PORTR|nr:hypothetical protein [Portunus trituberculatus]